MPNLGLAIDGYETSETGFIEGLELALAVYPEAGVGLEEKGITLRPSKPAISRI